MKRIQLERWSGQLLSPRTRLCCLRQWNQSTPHIGSRRLQSGIGAEVSEVLEEEESIRPIRAGEFASPPPEAAARSAKLAALHARLALPKKLPLQTMARALVDLSADPDPQFNNTALSQVGGSLISAYVSEWLLCHYPRLPMTVLFAANYAYQGPSTLTKIGKEWGVETAAYPGSEVDPGLLQFNKLTPGSKVPSLGVSTRPDYAGFYRRGISSRVVYDDEFGDQIKFPEKDTVTEPVKQPTDMAYSNFVKAVVGSIYIHAGRSAARSFVHAHILSRHLAIGSLFQFKTPVRELARLCEREEFEFPVARILSETGRHSRSPVFVVGIFSGEDKLAEGAGPNLSEARVRAAVSALKAWYLYSPGSNTRVPSEMEEMGAKPWTPVHIDMGEIIH
ncbi:60S ribosomal protein L3 [Calycina marina]|uniref:Large ribosomal subunit protein mL44 n=1 Tax=Calycina marina TaxID=1763456 RepID=A0A9P8CG86_9HELO|nr:60S ribosomal protein L3 [Calycina marina]